MVCCLGISEKDNNGNFFKGKTILKNSINCYVLGENRLIVGMGLENLVVDTSDAILVMHQNFAQEVKNVVNDLRSKEISEGQKHMKL